MPLLGVCQEGTSRHQEMYLGPKVAEEGEKPKRKRIVTTFSPLPLTASFLSVINRRKLAHPLQGVLRERQTRREAEAQSLRASSLGRGSRAAEQRGEF